MTYMKCARVDCSTFLWSFMHANDRWARIEQSFVLKHLAFPNKDKTLTRGLKKITTPPVLVCSNSENCLTTKPFSSPEPLVAACPSQLSGSGDDNATKLKNIFLNRSASAGIYSRHHSPRKQISAQPKLGKNVPQLPKPLKMEESNLTPVVRPWHNV